MKLWLLTVLIAILASCNSAPREEAPSKEVLTYIEILKQSLEADTLQPCFYRMPGGFEYLFGVGLGSTTTQTIDWTEVIVR